MSLKTNLSKIILLNAAFATVSVGSMDCFNFNPTIELTKDTVIRGTNELIVGQSVKWNSVLFDASKSFPLEAVLPSNVM
jgi:hypothetical protein